MALLLGAVEWNVTYFVVLILNYPLTCPLLTFSPLLLFLSLPSLSPFLLSLSSLSPSSSLSLPSSLFLSVIPVITQYSHNTSSLVSESILLQCNFKGRPLPSLEWRFNDQIITGNSSKYIITSEGGLLIHDVRLVDAGQYYCSVSNDFGSDTIVTELYLQGKRERGRGRERDESVCVCLETGKRKVPNLCRNM